jgi:hypothetical protein
MEYLAERPAVQRTCSTPATRSGLRTAAFPYFMPGRFIRAPSSIIQLTCNTFLAMIRLLVRADTRINMSFVFGSLAVVAWVIGFYCQQRIWTPRVRRLWAERYPSLFSLERFRYSRIPPKNLLGPEEMRWYRWCWRCALLFVALLLLAGITLNIERGRTQAPPSDASR